MSIFLDRIDAAPLSNNEFSYEFNQWVSVLIDSLNETIRIVQDSINLTIINSYTAAQITSLAPSLVDGVIMYDSTNNEYVGQISGVLVKFVTAPYP
jgi:hypothetical protein